MGAVKFCYQGYQKVAEITMALSHVIVLLVAFSAVALSAPAEPSNEEAAAFAEAAAAAAIAAGEATEEARDTKGFGYGWGAPPVVKPVVYKPVGLAGPGYAAGGWGGYGGWAAVGVVGA